MFTILHAIGLYEFILIIVGTIGNLSVFFVSLNIKNNTFILIRFLSIGDIMTLYFWNLNHFTKQFFHLDLQNFNFYFCKFFQFSQYTSLQISAWILVTIIRMQNSNGIRNLKFFCHIRGGIIDSICSN